MNAHQQHGEGVSFNSSSPWQPTYMGVFAQGHLSIAPLLGICCYAVNGAGVKVSADDVGHKLVGKKILDTHYTLDIAFIS